MELSEAGRMLWGVFLLLTGKPKNGKLKLVNYVLRKIYEVHSNSRKARYAMKKYLYQLRGIIFVKISCAVISIAALAAIPYLNKFLFDQKFKGWGDYGILWLIGLYILVYIINSIFEYISQKNAWKLDWKFHLLIKDDLFHALLRQPYREFMKKSQGEYLSLFTNDIAVASQYISSCVAVVQTGIQILVYGIFIFSLNIYIGLVIVAGTFLAMLAPAITGKTLAERRKIWVCLQGSYIEKLRDLFAGFREVNRKTQSAMGNEQSKVLRETEDSMLHYGKFSTFTHILNGGFLYAVNILSFISVGILFVLSKITLGTGVAALGYAESFIEPLRYILEEISNIKSTKQVTENLMEYINQLEKGEEEKAVGSKSEKAAVETLELKDICKSYEGFEIQNFSYRFVRGRRYALIGHNGCGKSTILELIRKSKTEDSGIICFDGMASDDIHVEDYVSLTGVGSHIFEGDFTENVTVFGAYDEGKPPENFDFGSGDFSAGEKQVICMLRAFAENAPVELFDEPFSAMDMTNKKILSDMLQKQHDKIVIVATHDLGSEYLGGFDEVLLMENGRLKVWGTPEEVIATSSFQNLRQLTDCI